MTIIDTHAHLDHLPNLDQALRNADEAGVEAIVAMSMDLVSCQKNLTIKQSVTKPKIYLALGMHPSEANRGDVDKIISLIKDNTQQLNAIGEIGLDFTYKWVRKDENKRNEQREVFAKLLTVAKELDLPAVVHARGAEAECFKTVKAMGIKKANFHWYSGPLDVLNDIMLSGYFVSTSPSVAFSPQSRAAMSHATIEQTLIETDCPVFFGNKDDGTGYEAQPKDVWRTLKAYCELRNIKEEEALKIFNQNARKFFERISPPLQTGSHEFDVDENILSSPNVLIGDLKILVEDSRFRGNDKSI